MKKKIPGEIGALYRTKRMLLLNCYDTDTIWDQIDRLPVGSVVMLLEKRKSLVLDFDLATTDGHVG